MISDRLMGIVKGIFKDNIPEFWKKTYENLRIVLKSILDSMVGISFNHKALKNDQNVFIFMYKAL